MSTGKTRCWRRVGGGRPQVHSHENTFRPLRALHFPERPPSRDVYLVFWRGLGGKSTLRICGRGPILDYGVTLEPTVQVSPVGVLTQITLKK